MLLGSKRAKELVLLLQGLESAMTVFGRGVDELDVEWLQVRSLGSWHQALSEGDWALSGAANAALKHEPVLSDLAVVRETTDRGDSLLSQIRLSGSRLVIVFLANAKNSLVDFSAVVVTHLTSTGHSEANAGRMPCTNTGDFAKTTMCLARKAGNTPSAHDTSESVTASGRANIQHLTFAENLGDIHFLFEQGLTEINLGSNITTIDLDFQQVGDLLS